MLNRGALKGDAEHMQRIYFFAKGLIANGWVIRTLPVARPRSCPFCFIYECEIVMTPFLVDAPPSSKPKLLLAIEVLVMDRVPIVDEPYIMNP